MPLIDPLGNALRDAWALLMPVDCAGCGAHDRSLCPACLPALLPEVTLRSGPDGVRVFSALRYEERVRRVILAFKEQDRTDVATALAAPLATAVLQAMATLTPNLTQRPELLAVPTSRSAYRRRGYDPVRLLLKRAGLRSVRLLEHSRRTSAQKSLGALERAENSRGSLVARRRLDGRRFLIVDDVLTSGATIREAVRAVRAAGGEVIGAATLAFTPRLYPIRDIGRGEDYGMKKGA